MRRSYSAREAAEACKAAESTVRAWIRELPEHVKTNRNQPYDEGIEMLIEMAKVRIPEKWEDDDPSPQLIQLQKNLEASEAERKKLQEQLEAMEAKLLSNESSYHEERRRMTEERESLTQSLIELTKVNAVDRKGLSDALNLLANVSRQQQEQLERSQQFLLEAEAVKRKKGDAPTGFWRRLFQREKRVVDASEVQDDGEQ